MKKSLEMRNKLEGLKNEAQTLLDENKVTDAQDKMEEIKNLKNAISIQEALEKEEEGALAAENNINSDPENNGEEMPKNKAKKNANCIRAMIKKVTGRSLTEAENALLVQTPQTGDGSGEGYLLPTDVSTLIHKKIREYRSLRDAVGYMPAGALTGSFPVEDFETVSELIDFTDGTDGSESNDIKFKNVSYALKEKAAFIKLSNTLLKMTDNALISYVVEVFAKKAVITENKMIITKLKENKTIKALKGWKDLKSSLNKDLDPAVLFGTVIVTNQTGFDYLDGEIDTTGKPILNIDVANPTQRKFKGYTVLVYSDAMLQNTGTKAPIFYGNLAEAIKFIDYNGLISFATSSEAGFMSNTTIARLIEFIDVIQVDKSDKCYIAGTIDTTATGA
ncbi:phage major capsid protein [Clostridium botulinum]|uniref:Phage major capsid protein n=1 Tax=Clostridium botulinum TaxID=1491 RepID=A0A6B4N8Y0_CLOBO|nr:phage major capsid protein [Clostridium botulinum]EES50506.1 phage major capsid protein, HK97 family [Clostridium botulinum E1 str. 'BoNT E Beluga']MBY6760572.1 phage major capsid protein [Clostridium botulinum]MBY6919479.1 phage major capsid protein [Clostridium botulinum]MCR1130357.1 phage major capsid protein [Clostridium botulinum]NFJ56888.1 phage major capsid protein [Clostridium botulinum]